MMGGISVTVMNLVVVCGGGNQGNRVGETRTVRVGNPRTCLLSIGTSRVVDAVRVLPSSVVEYRVVEDSMNVVSSVETSDEIDVDSCDEVDGVYVTVIVTYFVVSVGRL